MVAISITYVRWFLLVRGLELPFTLKDAFRLGFIGYLFNFLTLGVVGGDALKAIFVARQIPDRKAAAIATVGVDRVIGLFALFVVASVAYLSVDLSAITTSSPGELIAVQRTGMLAVAMTIAGIAAYLVLLVPRVSASRMFERIGFFPKLGGFLDRLIDAMRIYRRKPVLLIATGLMSLCVHSLNVMAIFLIACGLPGDQPSFGTHFMIVPIAMLAGAVPLPGGLGAFEFALDFLYRGVSSRAMIEGQGFVIALAFRVITLMIAAIGVVYYLASRREVSEAIKQAEEQDRQQSENVNAAPEAIVS